MSSRARIIAVHGNSFDAGVLPAGELSAAPAPAPPKTPDPLTTRLVDALDVLKGNDRELCKSLLMKRQEVNQQCQELLNRATEQAHTNLAEEWESSKARCRTILAEIDTMKSEIAGLEQDLAKAKKQTFDAAVKRDSVEAEKRTLSRFAPAKEGQKLAAALVKAEAEATACREAEAPIQLKINGLALEGLTRLHKKLQLASAEELRLRALITGEGYTDSEFGIAVSARG